MKKILALIFAVSSTISFAGDADGTGSDPSASQESSEDTQKNSCFIVYENNKDFDDSDFKVIILCRDDT